MKNQIFVLLILFVVVISCSDKEESNTTPEGIFIEINNDVRPLSLVDGQDYNINISSSDLIQTSSYGEFIGKIGISFDLVVQDNSRSYIGGIGGITSCEGISISVIVIDDEISSEENYKTYYFETPDSIYVENRFDYVNIEDVKNKCLIELNLLNDRGKTIISGLAASNFTVNVKKSLGEYTVEFNNIKFETEEESFTASARLITD
jgi:hypothetical protein